MFGKNLLTVPQVSDDLFRRAAYVAPSREHHRLDSLDRDLRGEIADVLGLREVVSDGLQYAKAEQLRLFRRSLLRRFVPQAMTQRVLHVHLEQILQAGLVHAHVVQVHQYQSAIYSFANEAR